MKTIAWAAALACLGLYALTAGRYAQAIAQSHARAQRAYATALTDEAQVRQAAGIAQARTAALRSLRSAANQGSAPIAAARLIRALEAIAASSGCRLESIAPDGAPPPEQKPDPVQEIARFDVQLRGRFGGIVRVVRALPHIQPLLEVTHLHIERMPGAAWTRTPELDAGFTITLYRLRLPQ